MFSTGEIKARVTSEKEVTLDDLIKEANIVWGKCRARGLEFSDTKEFLDESEDLMSDMRKEHPEFCKSYPIVLRYMAQMQEFSPDAFKLYLMKIKEHPWNSQDEYFWSQADYVVLLYRKTAKKRGQRVNTTQTTMLRKNIYQMLKNESDIFEANVKAIEKEVIEEEKLAKQRKDNNLRAHYAKYGEECIDIKTRAISDVSTDKIVDVDNIVNEKIFVESVSNLSADSLLQ